MKQYMYLFRGGDDVLANQSPEEIQQHMQLWQAWMQTLANSGNLISGEPLEKEGKTLIDRGGKILDRPFAEGKELIGGFLLIKASDENQAVELAKGCPIFELEDGTVEVRKISEMSPDVDFS